MNGPSVVTPAARGALAQARENVRGLVAAGRPEEACEFLLAALAAVLEKSRELELLVAKLRRGGSRRSERVNAEQLALLVDQLLQVEGAAATAVDLETAAQDDATLEQEIGVAECAATRSASPASRRSRDWQAPDATRTVHQCTVADDARTCTTCGRALRSLGADVTHTLEYVPGQFVEHEYQLEKLACGYCKDGVTTAAGPQKILERSAAGASTLARIVVSKFADHLPLTRQHRIYARDGVTIPVSTMADWVAGVADLVAPVVECLAARVLGAYVVRTDATGLRVLVPARPEHTQLGTMWCFVGDDRDVVFRYAPTGEGASGPWPFLHGRRGYVQADAASVFNRLYDGTEASAIEVGCWAHGRRRFVALEDTDCRVAYPIQLITRLYRIERLGDARNLSPPERTLLRQERCPAVLDKLGYWVAATVNTEPPASDLAKAARYLVNQWQALIRFVDDGRLSLDNNLCERQLRAIALGRHNYLFAGSHQAAHRTAVLYSLLHTCAQHGVAPLPYLTELLPKLASGEYAGRLDELLPDRWHAAQTHAGTA